MALVLFLPFSVRKIEQELEAFLLVMGLAALAVSGGWSLDVLLRALREPLPITAAVLAFGLAFSALRRHTAMLVNRTAEAIGLRPAVFVAVTALGLASGIVTVIIAALIFCEILPALNLDSRSETQVAVTGCFALGMGAALTPLGGPLAVMAAARLAGGGRELWHILSPWLLPAIAALALVAAALAEPSTEKSTAAPHHPPKRDALTRAARIYVFVAALVLLGSGMAPLAAELLPGMKPEHIYWMNISSAALDNATLAAAELGTPLPPETLTALLLGLVIAGGMLIPGNIPNIICADRLRIRSRRWAAFGVPLGLAIMLVYFVILKILL
jgi:predicted cation transporter